MMNRRFVGSLVVAAIMSMASVVAFAGGSMSVSLTTPSFLKGVRIEPGDYKVKWESNNPAATVTFYNRGKEIATAEGQVEERTEKFRNDSLVYDSNPDGSRTIKEIRFAGKRQVIVFGR